MSATEILLDASIKALLVFAVAGRVNPDRHRSSRTDESTMFSGVRPPAGSAEKAFGQIGLPQFVLDLFEALGQRRKRGQGVSGAHGPTLGAGPGQRKAVSAPLGRPRGRRRRVRPTHHAPVPRRSSHRSSLLASVDPSARRVVAEDRIRAFGRPVRRRLDTLDDPLHVRTVFLDPSKEDAGLLVGHRGDRRRDAIAARASARRHVGRWLREDDRTGRARWPGSPGPRIVR